MERRAVDTNTQFSTTTIKCRVGSSLNTGYERYKQFFRDIAEEFSVVRCDAMNFASYLVVLHFADPAQNPLPELSTRMFWSHCYRLATNPSENRLFRLRETDVKPYMLRAIDRFDELRTDPATGRLWYNVPVLHELHRHFANAMLKEVFPNIKVHLTNNIKKFLRRVVHKFLIHHKKRNPTCEYAPSAEADKWVKTIVERAGIYSNADYQAISPNGYRELRAFMIDRYREFEEAFERRTIDGVGESPYAERNYHRCLLYYHTLLGYAKANPHLQIRNWTLLPVSTHGVVHFNISGKRGLHELFVIAERRGYPVPPVVLDKDGQLLGAGKFDEKYAKDEVFKNNIWKTLFNLKGVFKKKLIGKRNAIPNGLEELNYLDHPQDVSDWTNGFLELRKEPQGLTTDDRLVGIDPGVRDLITMVDGKTTKDNFKEHSWSISNAEYQERIGTKWQRRKEKHSRTKAGIQEVYDRILTSKTNALPELEDYIRSISETRERVFDFMKRYKHREIKGNLYSNRQSTQAMICDTVRGINPWIDKVKSEEMTRAKNKKMTIKMRMPFKMSHNRDVKALRDKRRKKRKDQKHMKPTARTIVAYGDAKINSSMRYSAPLPQKGIQRVIARKSIVIRTDEFRTSQRCNRCGNRLQELNEEEEVLDCEHTKRRRYIKKLDGSKRRKLNMVCLDKDNDYQRICNAVDCNLRRPRGYTKTIWALKLCFFCNKDNTTHWYWNRDLNAAINIWLVLLYYIWTNGSMESRPEHLKRKRDD